jgi:hypothetical protein
MQVKAAVNPLAPPLMQPGVMIAGIVNNHNHPAQGKRIKNGW